MSALMDVDVALDEIVKHQRGNNSFNKRGRRGRSNFGGRGNFNPQRSLPDRWVRDLHTGGYSASQNQSARSILVSNLNFLVTDEDIRELFSEFGPIKKCYVNYDKSGRSHGTAEVVFHRQEHAHSAVNKYNNVALDGRPMKLQFVSASSKSDAPQRSYQKPFRGSGPRRTHDSRQNNFKPSFRKGPSRQFKSKPQAQQPRGVITKESLDAELEAYKRITAGD